MGTSTTKVRGEFFYLAIKVNHCNILPQMAKKRLEVELKQIRRENAREYSSVGPIEDRNIFVWQACLAGPPGTPYERGKFKTELRYPTDYPFKPPKVRFITKIFHPNISQDGDICVDILDKAWSPAITTTKLLISLSSLLSNPNPFDPLSTDAAAMYKTDPVKYNDTARRWTGLYAK